MIPKHGWHYGKCDDCGRDFILILHFGYATQPIRDYRICKECLKKSKVLDEENIRPFCVGNSK